MEREPPACLAFLLCERLEQDPVTTRLTLHGLLDAVFVRSVPAVVPGFVVFAELVGDRGRTDLSLRFARIVPSTSRGRTSEMALPLHAWLYPTIVLRDPTTVAKIIFHPRDLALPQAGPYLFGLEAGGVLIAARRLMVKVNGDRA